jgi:ribosomal protein S12 methylthiotransferase accessory factor
MTGLQSHFLLNFSHDFLFYQPLVNILKFLEDKKIVKWIDFGNSRYNDVPFFYHVDITPSYEPGFTDGEMVEKTLGHGFGKNAEEVFSKAIGEVLERYFLTIYRKKDLIRSSSGALKNKKISAIDLSLLDGFLESQKRNNRLRFNEQSIFYWGQAKRVLTGAPIYLPAQFLFWNYIREESEPFLCEGNTNGGGGFFTKEGAILSGLYELIQRDSFFIYWLNGLVPELIDPKTVPGEDFQKLLCESERYGFEVYCLNLACDTGVPTFAVVVSDPSGKGPRFCLGGGCQANPAAALRRALEEAWSVYFWMMPQAPCPVLGKDYIAFQKKIGQNERLRLWSNPEMADRFKFFLSGQKKAFKDITFKYPESFVSQSAELEFLVKRIESNGPGYEVYYYMPDHPVLSDLGYYSAQVIVPELIPLYLTEFNAPLGKKRLKKVPEKLGLKARAAFNPWPHPFP